MSISVCVQGLVAEGKIPQGQAAEADRLYAIHLRDLSQQMGMMPAAALASERTIAAMKAQLIRKKMLAAATIGAQQRILTDLGKYGGGGSGPIDPRAGAALFDHDPRAPYSNIEARRMVVRGQAQAHMDKVMADHSANLLGRVRNPAQLADLVREAFGEDSGNAMARELAGAWNDAAELLRQRFNAAGGDIGKLEKWGLPQSHDWRRVRAAGFEAWREAIVPRLDRAKMIDRETGRPFGDAKLDEVLGEVFDTIRSNGIADVTPGASGKGALANRRGDARFLVFRSADAWLGYADQFGSGNAYDAMMGHIDGMARDIAAMEILGPNPAHTVGWLKDTLVKAAAVDRSPDSKGVGKAKAAGERIDELWGEYSGAHSDPRNETLALVFSSIRTLQTAAKLGGAYLSSFSDFATMRSRAAFDGLPTARVMGRYAKLFAPGSLEDQQLAVRRGLIAREWSSRTAAQSRYIGEELTGEIPRRLAEGTLRLSLLSRHDQALRWAFGMEALATFTEQRGKALGQLDQSLRGMLERHGIGEAEWEKLRTAPVASDRGADWISPHASGDRALGDRFLEMILSETDLAVPIADLGIRATLNSKLERGTWIGEIGRSALLFKSFGISLMLRQAREIMAMRPGQAAGYATGLFIGTTLMGALSLQLKDLAAGRDPRDMTSPEFWGAAALQGGGFGIFGDFLKSASNRLGNGISTTLAGPLAQDVDNLIAIARARNPQGKALKTVRSLLPGGTIWYARTAFDRMVTDQIQQAIDPDYRKSWNRIDKYAREQGTEYYWRPGDQAPERAPDFSNATEGQ